MRRSLAGALLALMLAAALICPAWGEDFRPLLENRPLTAGDSVSDWLAVASGRAGLQRPDYLRDLESYVTSMYRENGGLDRIKATEWHRITLAVQAQGGDPTAFGRDREGKPIDLVAEGTYNWSRSRSLGAQGLNGWIFALITLDSGGFAVPEGAAYTREDMIAAIQGDTVRRIFSARVKTEGEVKRERVADGIVASTSGDGTVKKQPRKVQKIGRNDPCPCGSGKKYKQCCGR